MDTSIDNLQFNIIYSSRKSIAIEIKMDSIIVRAPRRMLRHDIYAFLEKKRPWIEKNLVKIEERKNAIKDLNPFTVEEIRNLAQKASMVIPDKVKRYAQIIGVDYGRIKKSRRYN